MHNPRPPGGFGTPLRPAIQPLVPSPGVPVRKMVLFEGLDEFGRLQPMLGTLVDGSKTWFEPITENPMLNDVEEWEVYNATGDAHPIHLHLVAFQIKNRETYTATATTIPRAQIQHGSIAGDTTDADVRATYGTGAVFTLDPITPFVAGSIELPPAHEVGWKDTFIVRVRFPPPFLTGLKCRFFLNFI